MLDAADAAELRRLQESAYGRGGELTAEEWERLQELEGRVRSGGVRDPVPQAVVNGTAPDGISEELGVHGRLFAIDPDRRDPAATVIAGE